MKCKRCGVPKKRIATFDEVNLETRFKDEVSNKLWKGKLCPPCYTEKSREDVRRHREKKRQEEQQNNAATKIPVLPTPE